jgi:hypothetical protein
MKHGHWLHWPCFFSPEDHLLSNLSVIFIFLSSLLILWIILPYLHCNQFSFFFFPFTSLFFTHPCIYPDDMVEKELCFLNSQYKQSLEILILANIFSFLTTQDFKNSFMQNTHKTFYWICSLIPHETSRYSI